MPTTGQGSVKKLIVVLKIIHHGKKKIHFTWKSTMFVTGLNKAEVVSLFVSFLLHSFSIFIAFSSSDCCHKFNLLFWCRCQRRWGGYHSHCPSYWKTCILVQKNWYICVIILIGYAKDVMIFQCCVWVFHASFSLIERLTNLGKHTLFLSCAINEANATVSGDLTLPSYKLNFTIKGKETIEVSP